MWLGFSHSALAPSDCSFRKMVGDLRRGCDVDRYRDLPESERRMVWPWMGDFGVAIRRVGGLGQRAGMSVEEVEERSGELVRCLLGDVVAGVDREAANIFRPHAPDGDDIAV